ncbi:MAG: cell division protein FtsZ, partial [Gammaproteobacteria bacterium]
LGNPVREEALRVKLVQDAGGDVDYKKFDRPTVIRNQTSEPEISSFEGDPDYLDIPAFLRRQAD